jgi:hippurate hydrolase
VNHQDLTERTGAVFRAAFGEAAVAKTNYITASEDYSQYLLAGVSHSLFFEIGIYDPARVQAAKTGGPPLPFNHSPQYAPVPEPTIRTGVKAMTLAVLNALEG